MPLLPNSERITWVRIADPTASDIALTKESKESLAWLPLCVQATPQTLTSSTASWQQTLWRKETQWELEDGCAPRRACAGSPKYGLCVYVRSQSPLAAAPQGRAKLHSLQMARSRLDHKYLSCAMPAGSDNTPAEAGVNKLVSTAWPLSLFLRLVASWSHAHSVALLVSHISGQKNVWADELSRDELDRFRSKPLARFRFTLSQLCQPEGITLHPSHARWRENFVEAAA